MADGKRSALIYCDTIHTVKKLTDEQAGKLFKHFLKYINDEDPQTDDFVVEIAFEPIKQALKRDLRKYNGKVDERSISGRLGNLKRWYPDLYKKYENGTKTLLELEEIANNRKVSHSDNSDRKSRKQSQTIANIADTVIDSVSVIDSDSDILLKKETKGASIKKTPTPEITLPFDNEVFRAQWSHWKVFKAKEFNFKYKSLQSEQAALLELAKKSGDDQKTAIAIIHQSMANGWKGFFELKSNDNKKPTFSTNR